MGIGLAGLGRWGRNYVKTLLGLSECRLVAVADPDQAARTTVADLQGVAACESAAGLLSNPAIEAVVVATPDRTHFAVSMAALEAGRSVLVEKPMTLVAAEAEALVHRAEHEDLVLAVGHTAVYSADLDSLRAQLDGLASGATRRVRAERTSSGPTFVPSSVVLRPSSVIFDLCPHDIALAILLLGSPVATRAHSNEKSVEYEIRFPGGETLEGRAEWREPPHVRRFEVAGTEESARGGPPSAAAGDVRTTPLGRQCLDFIACCRTRRQPLSSGRLGLAVARCLEALVSSCSASGEWMQFSKGSRAANGECRIEGAGIRETGVRA